jgi:hypothetical protein
MTQPTDNTTTPDETTVMIVWPTIGAYRLGRLVGQLCGVRLGLGRILTLGKLFALTTIPISLTVFAWQLMPWVCRRYRLTTRRIIIQKGLSAVDGPSIDLDAIDAIDVKVLPGQEWLHAGELVFLRDGTEVFRLSGVSRPEPFRQVCLKTRTALLSVREVVERQTVSSV